MAKRSYTRRVSKPVIEEAGESPPETVRLVSVLGYGEYIITGKSGKQYTFVKNLPLEVEMEDAKEFLEKKRGCCGTPPQPIFVTV